MKILVIVDPMTLVGEELREFLSHRRELWDEVRLLTTEPDSGGMVTEMAGSAKLVSPFDRDSLAGANLVFFCGDSGDREELADELPADSKAIVLDPQAEWRGALPTVAGVNLDAAHAQRLLISPAPTVILLAHLLFPIRALVKQDAVAQVLLPASASEQAGLEEIFEQTRAILSMRDERPTRVFGRQLAFNLLPKADPQGRWQDELSTVLGEETPIALQAIQAGVFHSLAVGLFLDFRDDPGRAQLRELWSQHPYIEPADEPALLGPIDAAARENVLLGEITPALGRPGAYWVWAAMDNLTRGGALNAGEIAATLLAR